MRCFQSWLFNDVTHRPLVAYFFGRIQGRVQDRLGWPAFPFHFISMLLRPVGKFLRPIQTHRCGKIIYRDVLAQPSHVFLVTDFVEFTSLHGILIGDFLDDRLDVVGQAFPVAVVDRQAVPSDRAEANGGVVLAHFMQFEHLSLIHI